MADELTAAFNLNVESNAKQIAAEGAEGLADFQERMQGSVAELRNLNTAMRSLKGAAGVSGSALEDLKAKIGAQKAAIAAQNQAYLRAGGTFRELAERNKVQAAREAVAKKQELEANKRLLEQGKLSSSLKAKEIALGLAYAEGLKELAVGAFDAAKGIAAAVVSLFQFGVAAADARRSEELQLEGMSKIRYGLFGLMGGFRQAADSGQFLQTALDTVADNSAVGRDQLAGYEAQLYRTGLRAGNLQVALQAMATVASTQGDAQAQRFAGMAAGARYAGVSIKALADDVKARLGGIAERQMLSLTVQTQKLHESFARLFSGLKLEPLLRGVREITSLFTQQTAQGQAMKMLLEAMFQPLIDEAPTAGLIAKKVITGLLIGLTELYDWSLRAQIAWIEIFGSSKAFNSMHLAREACFAASLAVGVLAGGLTVLALNAAALAAPFIGFVTLLDGIDDRLHKWGGTWKELGTQLVLGLVSGLTGGVPALVAGVGQLGEAALTAFRKKFDIHSPSRVMRRDGSNIVKGEILGMRDMRPQLEREVEATLVAPVVSRSSSGSGSGGGAARGGSVTFGDIHIHGATDADSVAQGLKRGVELLLSGALIQAGGAVA